ncbi:MAG TPA: radical SAM protein [Sedimentisphaerales bacterium]|nr:radical SAM protein [Sedimentisphaerales bacterium]
MSVEQYKLNEIKLELTYQCLLKCIHCSSNAGIKGQPVMSYKIAENIVHQAIVMDVKKIAFSGGEPLLWNDLASLVKICSDHNTYTVVYTSGISDNSTKKINCLKSNGLSSIIFSLYSTSSPTHESITHLENSYQDTLKAIKHSQSIGLKTELHFVPMKHNYQELPLLARLAKDIGLKQISILRFVPQGRGLTQNNLALSKDETRELQSLINEAKKVIHLRIGSPYSILFCSQSPKCMAGIDKLTISPELSIIPCDAFKQVNGIDVVGTDMYSSLDRWTLAECWQKSPYLNAIRKYIEAPLESPCSICDNANKCFSGCTAQKYLTYKQLRKAPDPLCLRSA